ncbi:MAG TPA: DUF3857 and transglutaminase domain-containing protein [Blastocatellia bacterium]|nr:DUF3857 and transglutaminase domain-containing protein [Blastocatellia bacterium]
MFRFWTILFFILTFLMASGRPSAGANWKSVSPQELKMKASDIGDPDADAAILFREGELNDNNAEGTGLKVYIRIKIFNERGRRYADVQLPYRVEQGRITDVHARTIRPDGTSVQVEDRDIFDKLLVKTSHGVWRAKVFSMPAVEAGSIIEYRYRQTYPQGFRYFALDLQSELFTKQLHYQIQPQAASRLDVRWVSFNAPDARRFMPVWDGSYDIKADNIPPFRREPLMPPELAVKIWGWIYYSDEIENNPEKYWRNYAQRVYDRASYETRASDAIRRVVESITLSNESPQQKLARIYHYIQTEIHNTGFAPERGAEREADTELKRNDTADETIRRRYGTPREINRLFVAMLKAAGMDARVAELTTRDENFFHRSFADAFQFNSEVTAVIARDGAVQFYDPGTPYCPPGMLSWEKEGVTALVYDKRDARFVETPVTDAAINNEDRRLSIAAFADGRAEVRAETKLTGQRALELRNELIGLVPEEQRKMALGPARNLLPQASIDESSAVLSNLTNLGAPIELKYNFTAPQFVTRAGSRLLLRPLLLSHRDESLTAAPRRSNMMYFHYPWSESERVIIEPPAGYEIEQLPDPVNIDIGAARYLATFTRLDQRVVYERRLMVNAITFTVDQYPTVKAFFDRVHQADRAVISFKQ